jgi:hypothetical protein
MASWIDSEINGDDHELTPERSSRHWVRCLEQAADADICLFYAPECATQCGSLIEIGAALVSGREGRVRLSMDDRPSSEVPHVQVY